MWALTPYKTIKLVHAVRQPLATPELGIVLEQRSFGDTFVNIGRNIAFSRKSTGRVELYAAWPDPVDTAVRGQRPTQPSDFAAGSTNPVPVTRSSLPVHLNRPGGGPDWLVVNERQELGDRKHKVITYEAEATTKFTEYFTRTVTKNPSGDALVVDEYGDTHAPCCRIGPSSRRPSSSARRASPRPGPAGPARNRHGRSPGTALLVLHDDAARVIPVATPLEVIFVETPVSRFSKLPKTLVAPATARPASVTINRAVPTFGWNRTYTIPLDSSPNSTHSTTSTRDGATLRIYLERPWWSSGVGEKLGVVYYPGGENATADDIPAALVPFVTQWGADPTVSSPALPTPLPIASAFPNAVGGESNLFLDEVPHIDGQADQLVAVAAHEVAFDTDQNLWYADVRIVRGSSPPARTRWRTRQSRAASGN